MPVGQSLFVEILQEEMPFSYSISDGWLTAAVPFFGGAVCITYDVKFLPKISEFDLKLKDFYHRISQRFARFDQKNSLESRLPDNLEVIMPPLPLLISQPRKFNV